jgi:hypothetical protein
MPESALFNRVTDVLLNRIIMFDLECNKKCSKCMIIGVGRVSWLLPPGFLEKS